MTACTEGKKSRTIRMHAAVRRTKSTLSWTEREFITNAHSSSLISESIEAHCQL